MDWRLAGSWDQTLWAESSVLGTHSIALRTAAAQMATSWEVSEAAAVVLPTLGGRMTIRLELCGHVVATAVDTLGTLEPLHIAAAFDRPAAGMSCGACGRRRESPDSGHR